MIEVFYHKAPTQPSLLPPYESGSELLATGWYWWHCQPGCLPDSEAVGPFATTDEAKADAWRDKEESEDSTAAALTGELFLALCWEWHNMTEGVA